MRTRLILPSLVLVAATGCKQGPDYAAPELPVPDAFRGLEDEAAPDDLEAPTFGDLAWFDVFDDEALRELIELALAENHDVRIAAERVLQARSFVTITRSDLYPDVVAGGSFESTRITENGAVPLAPGIDEEQEQWSAVGDLAWELDFWGRFARATEAARAELLQTEYSRHAVIQSLVTDLAVAYFDLLLLDEQLRIAERNYESRQKSFELVSFRVEQGVSDKVEYRQAEGLVLVTAGLVPAIEQAIEQQENRIRFLTGANPGPVRRGRPLSEQPHELEIPVGIPSDLLARRPDVRAAEQGLIAANARIGEAKALLFPSIRLTAVGGVASEDLDDLSDGDSTIWNVSPSVTLPIFNAGRLRSNVEVTESQQREAAVGYLQVVQNAFREVADALVGQEKLGEVRDWSERREASLRDQVELSNMRYRGGVTSYFEVLDSERDHFDAELDIAAATRDELVALVVLYRALGGGWQETDGVAASGPQELRVVEEIEEEEAGEE